ADMGVAVDGRAADIEPDARRIDRLERLLPPAGRIMENERHRKGPLGKLRATMPVGSERVNHSTVPTLSPTQPRPSVPAETSLHGNRGTPPVSAGATGSTGSVSPSPTARHSPAAAAAYGTHPSLPDRSGRGDCSCSESRLAQGRSGTPCPSARSP